MISYYLTALGAFLISLTASYFLQRWARQRRLFVPPVRERDLHITPTPRVGGIAIVGSFLLVVFLFALLSPAGLDFTGEKVLGVDKNLLGLILAVLLLSGVNILDDYRQVPWQVRLAAQVVAALLIFLFGVRIQWLTNPFGGQIFLGGFEWLFIVVWLVGLSNVMNWLDGINGLAGGVGAIALAILFFLSISPEVAQSENALLAAIAFGSVVGFLPFNLFKAKAFMGDTGSVFLGFLIGVLAIISGGKIATAILVLVIPFMDALLVLVSRLIHHQSPFQPDKRHLHHRLLASGMKPWQIVMLFYGISLLFGLIALNTQALGKVQAAMAAVGLMAVLITIYSTTAAIRRKLKS